MEMDGMVDEAMVAEDVAVEVGGVVVEDGAIWSSLLATMIILNMMHHLHHVVSLHIHGILFPSCGKMIAV